MEGQDEFYRFIDKTIFKDIVNIIIATAVLCDYSVGVVHVKIAGDKYIWGLFLYYDGEVKNSYTIRFKHDSNGVYKFALNKIDVVFLDYLDVDSKGFLVMLNNLLNEL